ncbi:DUF397 domain-containing protein [Protofrankia symbiont of Coriaria ruscifolia]
MASARAVWLPARPTSQPDGPVLSFSREEWRAFTDGAKEGEFDI